MSHPTESKPTSLECSKQEGDGFVQKVVEGSLADGVQEGEGEEGNP